MFIILFLREKESKNPKKIFYKKIFIKKIKFKTEFKTKVNTAICILFEIFVIIFIMTFIIISAQHCIFIKKKAIVSQIKIQMEIY